MATPHASSAWRADPTPWRWQSPPSRSSWPRRVSWFAPRHAPIGSNRAAFDCIAARRIVCRGGRMIAYGFHDAVPCPRTPAGRAAARWLPWPGVVEAAAAASSPGPSSSTVMTSAIAAVADASAAALIDRPGRRRDRGHRAARTFERAGGSPGRRLVPPGIIRHDAGDRWRTTHPTGGASPTNGAALWFVLDARSPGPGLTIEQQRGTDLCTDVGVLHLADHDRPRGCVGVRAFQRTRPLHCGGPRGVRGGRDGAPVRRCRSRLHPHSRAVRQAGRRLSGSAAQGRRAAGERRAGGGRGLGCGAGRRRIRRPAPACRRGCRPDGGGPRPPTWRSTRC